MLVVDDNSPDGTGDLVEAAQPRTSRASTLLRRAGQARARHRLPRRLPLRARPRLRPRADDGLRLQPPSALPARTCSRSPRAADLVIGSRYVAGGGVANWPCAAGCSRASRTSTRACCCACPCATAPRASAATAATVLEAIDPFDVRASGYSFLEEMVWRVHHAGFSIREIPIVFEDRRLGVLEDRPGRDLPRRAPRADHRVPADRPRAARSAQPPSTDRPQIVVLHHGLVVGEPLEALERGVERGVGQAEAELPARARRSPRARRACPARSRVPRAWPIAAGSSTS